MFNPIEAKRRFTEAQIQKSFDSGINLSEEMSLEKAWNVGDEKQYQGVTYYVAGLNAKGKPLWRKKKDGGSAKNQTSTPAPRKPDKVSEKEGSALMGKLMEAWELDSNHSFGERKKWESKLVETLNKMGKSAEWFNENAEVIANADTGEYDDELEKLYDVNGIDDLFDLVREIGDDTENEPDNNDVIDSSNVGEKIISALKADQGGLNNSSAGKKAQMKIVAAAENFMKKNPKVKLSDEDLENIVGGDIDEIEEKYGELKGWDELNDSIELYFDTPIDDDTTGLDAAENKIANSKSDPRDKIAQDGGFKDYEEMKGYQDYVTQKNLLKKKSTKGGMRLLYQQEVTKYEKDHADLIKRIGSNN